jgi:hypothetical protein
MSFVSGGWLYVPTALKTMLDPTELNVAPGGTTLIETRCWLNPQLERLKKIVAVAIRAKMLNHFRLINDS